MFDSKDQHDLNSHIASIKADLFLLEREVDNPNPKVKQRLERLNGHVTALHQLLKTVLHDVTKASD